MFVEKEQIPLSLRDISLDKGEKMNPTPKKRNCYSEMFVEKEQIPLSLRDISLDKGEKMNPTPKKRNIGRKKHNQQKTTKTSNLPKVANLRKVKFTNILMIFDCISMSYELSNPLLTLIPIDLRNLPKVANLRKVKFTNILMIFDCISLTYELSKLCLDIVANSY